MSKPNPILHQSSKNNNSSDKKSISEDKKNASENTRPVSYGYKIIPLTGAVNIPEATPKEEAIVIDLEKNLFIFANLAERFYKLIENKYMIEFSIQYLSVENCPSNGTFVLRTKDDVMWKIRFLSPMVDEMHSFGSRAKK